MTDQSAASKPGLETQPTPLCRECGAVVPVPCAMPPEPPVDAWVRDRYGALHHHGKGGGWGTPGMMYFGDWRAMWHGRGPLVECGPWGHDG